MIIALYIKQGQCGDKFPLQESKQKYPTPTELVDESLASQPNDSEIKGQK